MIKEGERAATLDRETARCCRGVGDHQEWCHRRGRGEGRDRANLARPAGRRLAKKIRRTRREARRREKLQLVARARIFVEKSDRVAADPSRINRALADVTSKVNDALQTEDAWIALWREP